MAFLYLGFILVDVLSMLFATSFLTDIAFFSESEQQATSGMLL